MPWCIYDETIGISDENIFKSNINFLTLGTLEEGSYTPNNRNSIKSEQIENAPLASLISTEKFNSMLVLGSSGENVHHFGAFLSDENIFKSNIYS